MSGSGDKALSSAITHYLVSVGVDVQPWEVNPAGQKKSTVPLVPRGPFGVPLHSLPLSEHVEGVPQFLVEACELLRPHLHVEGLFRKCGSMTRIKALKTRLEGGEHCLELALPCDVATLVKQFLRDLQEPLIPDRLQGPLCQVQRQELEDQARSQLILLLTCLLPPGSTVVLRYLFGFLQDVAARCAQNKMDAANLAIVFAPNLFPNGPHSHLDGGAEEQLQRQAAVVQVLIHRASEIGTVPLLLRGKIEAALSDLETMRPSAPKQRCSRLRVMEEKRRPRRSMGYIVTEVLSKFKTTRAVHTAPFQNDSPDVGTRRTSFHSKRKASEDAVWAPELSAKKRRSILDGLSGDTSASDECFPGRPVAADPLQALKSPGPFTSSSPLDLVPDSATQLGSPKIRREKLQRNSYKKWSQRKPSVHSSPSPLAEQKDPGPKSSHVFFQNSKDLDPLSVFAKAAKPNGRLLMKTGMTEPPPELHRLQRNGTGSPGASFGQRARLPASGPQGTPTAPTTCEPIPEPRWPSEGAGPGPQAAAADASLGSQGPGEKPAALARKSKGWSILCRRHRGLRRSISWPENLSVSEATEQGEAEFSPAAVPLEPGGHEEQVFGFVERNQHDVEEIVTGMRQLGLPETSGSRVASGPEHGEGGLPETSLPPEPGLPGTRVGFADRLHPFDEAPKSGLKRLTRHLQRACSHGLNVAKPSPPKGKRGRRFGRSVSHESGLPLQGGSEMFPGHPAFQGAAAHPTRSPLQSFKAYGKQIFITHQRITLSLAGLRGRRDSPRPENATVSPSMEAPLTGDQNC